MDCRELSPGQLELSATKFDELSTAPLLAARHAHRDDTRQSIDRALLCDILDLPPDIMEPLLTLREQWTSEPSVRPPLMTASGMTKGVGE